MVFIMTQLIPGCPIMIYLGDYYTYEAFLIVQQRWGLDQPLVVQFINFTVNAFQGYLVYSFHFRRPVFFLISERFVYTFRIALGSFILAYIVGITTGTLAAIYRGTKIDSILMAIQISFISSPVFWTALILQIIFGLHLGVLPISGLRSWHGYVLPILTLGLRLSAIVARQTRTNMLDVIRQDYVRTARSKGLSEFFVIMKHAFKNALIPVVTFGALQFGGLVTGSMLVERVFTIHGLGSLIVDAFMMRDRPLLSGTVLYVGAVVVLMNMIADLLYGVVDPRIRVEEQG